MEVKGREKRAEGGRGRCNLTDEQERKWRQEIRKNGAGFFFQKKNVIEISCCNELEQVTKENRLGKGLLVVGLPCLLSADGWMVHPALEDQFFLEVGVSVHSSPLTCLHLSCLQGHQHRLCNSATVLQQGNAAPPGSLVEPCTPRPHLEVWKACACRKAVRQGRCFRVSHHFLLDGTNSFPKSDCFSLHLYWICKWSLVCSVPYIVT